MDELRIVAPYHANNGYSKHARALLACALAAGYRVQAVESDMVRKLSCRATDDGWVMVPAEEMPSTEKIHPSQLPEVTAALSTTVSPSAPTILLQVPHRMDEWHEWRRERGITGPLLGYTMLECDRMRPWMTETLSRLDGLLAPSEWVYNLFTRDCPRVSCVIMPDPVDPRTMRPLPDDLIVQAPGNRTLRRAVTSRVLGRDNIPSFLFLAVGTSHPRKNWGVMMHAFAEEFAGQDVGLIYHCRGSQDVLHMAAGCRRHGAWVEVSQKDLSDPDMAGLYGEADCLVAVGCEGFGLPIIEAALMERPAIVLDIGGQADLVTAATGYEVPAEMAPAVGQDPHYFSSGAQWATCSVLELRHAMQWAHLLKQWLRRQGLAAGERALTYTPEALAPRLRIAIEALA